MDTHPDFNVQLEGCYRCLSSSSSGNIFIESRWWILRHYRALPNQWRGSRFLLQETISRLTNWWLYLFDPLPSFGFRDAVRARIRLHPRSVLPPRRSLLKNNIKKLLFRYSCSSSFFIRLARRWRLSLKTMERIYIRREGFQLFSVDELNRKRIKQLKETIYAGSCRNNETLFIQSRSSCSIKDFIWLQAVKALSTLSLCFNNNSWKCICSSNIQLYDVKTGARISLSCIDCAVIIDAIG